MRDHHHRIAEADREYLASSPAAVRSFAAHWVNRPSSRTAMCGVLVSIVTCTLAVAGQVSVVSDVGVKTWLGRHQEFEDFIRNAKIVGPMEKIPVGVTSPRKVALEAGGPVASIAWKPIRPGRHPSGYCESYKAEIAAYEIDKLLDLNMVPPTVEKQIGSETGAAIMWVAGTTTFAEMGQNLLPLEPLRAQWNLQLVRAMMFDNLIGNEDPNLGNWLKDDRWNLVLIDHSRALRATQDLHHKMNQIDAELWERMMGLDEARLGAALNRWLDKNQIRAILQRRERMQRTIDRLVKEKGDAAVIIR